MQPFDYKVPQDHAEASALLAAGNGSVRPLLGGTDLLILLRGGAVRPQQVVDLKHLPGMRELRVTESGWLVIGAACTMNQVAADKVVREHYGLLVQACESVASYQLRNRATIGGNCCNASPAADSAPALYCFDAIMETYGPQGARRLPIREFFAGPRRNALLPGEFLTGIHLPPAPSRAAGAFNKLGRTKVGDISVVSVAVWAGDDGAGAAPAGRLSWRVAIGAAGPTPLRASEAEDALAADTSPEGIARAAQLASAAARPIDDIRASAAYRRAMVAVLTRRGAAAVLAALAVPIPEPSSAGGRA